MSQCKNFLRVYLQTFFLYANLVGSHQDIGGHALITDATLPFVLLNRQNIDLHTIIVWFIVPVGIADRPRLW